MNATCMKYTHCCDEKNNLIEFLRKKKYNILFPEKVFICNEKNSVKDGKDNQYFSLERFKFYSLTYRANTMFAMIH